MFYVKLITIYIILIVKKILIRAAIQQARAYCACSRCGWGLFGRFFSRLSFLFSFSLSLGDGLIQTEILSQRAVKPETTNQPTNCYSTKVI